MIVLDKSLTYWRSNDDWYEDFYDDDGKRVLRLTDKAPKEARESFERYQNTPVTSCRDVGMFHDWNKADCGDTEEFLEWKRAGYPPLERYLKTRSQE